jgi:hypothetical protein
VQRKVLCPNDFSSPEALAERLLDFSIVLGIGGAPFPVEIHATKPRQPAHQIGESATLVARDETVYETMHERFKRAQAGPGAVYHILPSGIQFRDK